MNTYLRAYTTEKSELLKRLPHDDQLEQLVLGQAMCEREALGAIVDFLKPQAFFRECNRLIYQAIQLLYNEGKATDVRTLIFQLKKEGNLEKAGGMSYVASTASLVAASSHIEDHALILEEYRIKRALIELGREVTKEGYDETVDGLSALEKAEKRLYEVGSDGPDGSFLPASALATGAIQEMRAVASREGLLGTSTGFADLDALLHGWQSQDLVILAGRPGMGKTSLMLQLMRHAAVRQNVGCAFLSLEMGERQLMHRMHAIITKIPFVTLRSGKLSETQWAEFNRLTKSCHAAPWFVSDLPAISLQELRSRCRRLKRRHPKLGIVFVDYLQLMQADTSEKLQNREQQISYITRGLKSVAKELDVTIIAGAQLSRAVEVRGGDKRPVLSDLRESGAIEQDADVVLFLYRPEYYGILEDRHTGRSTEGLAEVIVAKHRNGPTGIARLQFDATTTAFSSYPS